MGNHIIKVRNSIPQTISVGLQNQFPVSLEPGQETDVDIGMANQEILVFNITGVGDLASASIHTYGNRESPEWGRIFSGFANQPDANTPGTLAYNRSRITLSTGWYTVFPPGAPGVPWSFGTNVDGEYGKFFATRDVSPSRFQYHSNFLLSPGQTTDVPAIIDSQGATRDMLGVLVTGTVRLAGSGSTLEFEIFGNNVSIIGSTSFRVVKRLPGGGIEEMEFGDGQQALAPIARFYSLDAGTYSIADISPPNERVYVQDSVNQVITAMQNANITGSGPLSQIRRYLTDIDWSPFQ